MAGYGLVDLLAIAPTYLSVIVSGTQSLIVIRALRLLRVFRVFKFGHFVGEATVLRTALRASIRKIVVFLGTVLILVLIIGYGIIAVPTGIVTVELSEARKAAITTKACPECSAEGHDPDARFCKDCGAELGKE